MTTARLETFADGVFAIAATLLIIDVGLPEHVSGSLGRELLDLWPQYAAYAVSFVTIGIMWVNHHDLMRLVARVDRVFLFLNLGLLLGVAFVPFPTRVLAEFLRHEGGESAAFLYGLTFTTTAIFYISLWLYASVGGRLLRSDVDPREVSGITRSYLPGVPIYAAAALIGLVSAEVGAALFALIAAFYMISSARFGSRAEE
jgi:uncharacterized membrane protein